MKHVILLTAAALALATPGHVSGQASPGTIPDALRASTLPRQQLSGPRFGFTTFTGDVADLRQSAGKGLFMSQFGWQFETQLVSTNSGHQALLEWVVLVGGVEQNEMNLGVSWLAGYRLPNGMEFGAGPNIGLRKDGGEPTTSMVVAGGATVAFGELYVPLNVAFAFAEGGPRITTLLGWIAG